MIPGPCITLTQELRNEETMARMNRTGTRLTVREVRSMYPALDSGFFGVVPDEDSYCHSEIVAPEYTSHPCGCVAASCPQCRPLWYDADGNFKGKRTLWNYVSGEGL